MEYHLPTLQTKKRKLYTTKSLCNNHANSKHIRNKDYTEK